MATQKVKPDLSIRERQGPGRSRRHAYGSIATYALVAFVLFVVAVAAVGLWSSTRTLDAATERAAEEGPSVTSPTRPTPGKQAKPELILNDTSAYVMFVRSDHRTLGLSREPFRFDERVFDMLSRAEPTARGWALTNEDVRALVEILNDAGFERTSGGDTSLGKIAYTGSVIAGIDINRHPIDLRFAFLPSPLR